jgi:hypothetical protein
VRLAANGDAILRAVSTRLYLGKEAAAGEGPLGERVELQASDLLTHGLIVGMTGSGKTGLAIALIEEVLRSGVPVLAIDPKGDLANLLLLFDRLAPEQFAPWIDPALARRQGKDVAAAAAEAAQTWTSGLQEWGLSASDVAALKQAHDAAVYTPGSTAGVPLNMLQSLDAPSVPFEQAEEDLREEIAAFSSGLLALLRIEADPMSSREHVLLSALVEARWRAGHGVTLEELVGLVAEPPFDKMGALPLESVYPRKERQALMMALNTLLASPRFEAWREGEPLDVERLLHAPDGRPRLSVVYTAHLSDEERLFVTALLLEKVKTWMRRQGGTSELRALVYMDEIYGYFPPHPANPPPKRPLLTLLKQARAQGVSVVLATQNPVDLDYKGLANMGVWLVGKLQTRQDRERLRSGLLGAGMAEGEVETLLDATRKRVFLLHDVHRPRPLLLHSRFVMSYLRGPLTRDEVERLMDGRRPAAAAPAAAAARREAAGAAAPTLPAPWTHSALARRRGTLAVPYLMVKYSARYAKGADEVVHVRAWPLDAPSAAEVLDGEPLELEEDEVSAGVPAGVRFAELPPFMAGAAAARAVEKALRERLADKLEVTVWYDPVTERYGQPGEEAEAMAARLLSAGPGPDEAKLRERQEKKKRELDVAERALSGRKKQKWFSVGTAILSNLPGLLSGGRRAISRVSRGVSGVGTVLNQDRMEDAAEARVEQLRAEVAELDRQVTALMIVDATRFEEKRLAPAKRDVDLLRYDLLWVY